MQLEALPAAASTITRQSCVGSDAPGFNLIRMRPLHGCNCRSTIQGHVRNSEPGAPLTPAPCWLGAAFALQNRWTYEQVPEYRYQTFSNGSQLVNGTSTLWEIGNK